MFIARTTIELAERRRCPNNPRHPCHPRQSAIQTNKVAGILRRFSVARIVNGTGDCAYYLQEVNGTGTVPTTLKRKNPMKKRMLLSLMFLLTFALGLPSTPAAEEWVLHKKITKPGDMITASAFSASGNRLIVGTDYNDTAYNVQVYDGNTFAYLHGSDYTDSGQRDRIYAIATRKDWYEAAIAGAFNNASLIINLSFGQFFRHSTPLECKRPATLNSYRHIAPLEQKHSFSLLSQHNSHRDACQQRSVSSRQRRDMSIETQGPSKCTPAECYVKMPALGINVLFYSLCPNPKLVKK